MFQLVVRIDFYEITEFRPRGVATMSEFRPTTC